MNSIGYGSFAGCKSLKTITLPNSISHIGASAFWNCESLTDIKLPEKLDTLNASTFDGCILLKDIDFGNNLKIIGDRAFQNCKSLSNILLPQTLTTIGNLAFYECSLIGDMDFPEGLISIGVNSFKNCSSIKKISFPKSIETIGNDAFSSCNSIEEIYCNATEPVVASSNIFSNETYTQSTLFVPKGSIMDYYLSMPWGQFDNIKEFESNGIDDVFNEIDINCPMKIYDINGIYCSSTLENLPKGIYIIRQNSKTTKYRKI